MGRQIQLHALTKDVNELLIAMHDKEPLELAIPRGSSAAPDQLVFVPDNMHGQTLILWSKRFAPDLQRGFISKAQPPYYLVDEQTEPVFELLLSTLTMSERQPALTHRRIYGTFENKPPEFEKLYERIARYIRRHWHKNPISWMGGYVGPRANEWFERGNLLLPNFIPPVRSDWIKRLREQHPVE
jgi:hypothetical protein